MKESFFLNDYEAFKAANAPKNFSGFDYIHAIYKTEDLAPDFIFWCAKLFSPDFILFEDLIFLKEMFNEEMYQTYRKNGQSKFSSQFWVNLLEITGVFDNLSTHQALTLANMIADSWNRKLENDFKTIKEKARVIHDEELDEIFVVIGTPG